MKFGRMLEATIRPARRSDIEALSRLATQTYADAFGHTFLGDDLAAHLDEHLSPPAFGEVFEDDVFLLAEAGQRLIGYVQFGTAPASSLVESGEDQELRRLYVLSEFQNRGVGKLLMDSALAHPRLGGAKKIFLDVWEHNEGAQRLYRGYGFETIGRREFKVESGAETTLDLVMVRKASCERY